MNENRYKKIREDFEFTSNGYRMTAEQLAAIFKERGYNTLTHSAIRKIETDNRNVSEYELKGYCEVFNTTSDYLLGFSNVSTVDKDTVMVGRITGLSDAAIQTLISCKTGGILADEDFPTIDLLNFILSDKTLFHDFLNYLGLYLNNTYDTPCYLDHGIAKPLPDDTIRNTSFVLSKNERYIAIGKKQKEKVCGEDAYQTISLPVSLLESHAIRIVEHIIDQWKDKWKKEQE